MDANGAGHEPATIGGLQDRLGRALRSLGELISGGRLPKDLEPLLELAPPPGFEARIALHHAAKGTDPSQIGRDMRDEAGRQYWQPTPGHIVRIWYEASHPSEGPRAGEPDLEVREAPPSSTVRRVSSHLAGEIRDLVRELDRTERGGKPYVVLTWFRDTCLTAARFAWAGHKDDATAKSVRQRVLSEAVECGLIAVGKAANPNAPGQESATVRLERSHPDVVDALSASDPLSRFKPVPIRGEPLSQTVIRERR